MTIQVQELIYWIHTFFEGWGELSTCKSQLSLYLSFPSIFTMILWWRLYLIINDLMFHVPLHNVRNLSLVWGLYITFGRTIYFWKLYYKCISFLLYWLVTFYILCCRQNQAFWCRSWTRGPTITELARHLYRAQWGEWRSPHNQILACSWVWWFLCKCLPYDLSPFSFSFLFLFLIFLVPGSSFWLPLNSLVALCP